MRFGFCGAVRGCRGPFRRSTGRPVPDGTPVYKSAKNKSFSGMLRRFFFAPAGFALSPAALRDVVRRVRFRSLYCVCSQSRCGQRLCRPAMGGAGAAKLGPSVRTGSVYRRCGFCCAGPFSRSRNVRIGNRPVVLREAPQQGDFVSGTSVRGAGERFPSGTVREPFAAVPQKRPAPPCAVVLACRAAVRQGAGVFSTGIRPLRVFGRCGSSGRENGKAGTKIFNKI